MVHWFEGVGIPAASTFETIDEFVYELVICIRGWWVVEISTHNYRSIFGAFVDFAVYLPHLLGTFNRVLIQACHNYIDCPLTFGIFDA